MNDIEADIRHVCRDVPAQIASVRGDGHGRVMVSVRPCDAWVRAEVQRLADGVVPLWMVVCVEVWE